MREVLLAVVLVSAGLAGCVGFDDAGSGDAAQASRADGNATTEPTAADSRNRSASGASGNSTSSGEGTQEANATAGNATDGDGDDPPAGPTFPDGTPAPTTLTYQDCYEQWASLPVPAEPYRDLLPEGFSLASFQGEPTNETGTLFVLGQTCRGPDGAEFSRAFVDLAVDPPDAWEDDDALLHALMLSYVTTSQRRADVIQAWGFGAVADHGEVTLARNGTPAARHGTLQASAGETNFSLETAVEGQPVEAGNGTARQFALGPSGRVTGAMELFLSSRQTVAGDGLADGTAEAGLLGPGPVRDGVGFHSWELDQTLTYVDLPPREGS